VIEHAPRDSACGDMRQCRGVKDGDVESGLREDRPGCGRCSLVSHA
jgi:hypothetical protein